MQSRFGDYNSLEPVNLYVLPKGSYTAIINEVIFYSTAVLPQVIISVFLDTRKFYVCGLNFFIILSRNGVSLEGMWWVVEGKWITHSCPDCSFADSHPIPPKSAS